jgi:hypothetical protein
VSDDDALLRQVTREVLADLLPGLLEEALTAPRPENGNGNSGHAGGHVTHGQVATPVVEGGAPQVPAPPIAAVHRPPGWVAPSAPAPAPEPAQDAAQPASRPSGSAEVEDVDLRTDADLDAFVRSLVRRLENPRDRMAIRAGRVRFRLRSGPAAAPAAAAGPVMRVERGAVTERTVREAADAGARLVLAPRAVLTPMARDRARTLGVEIEKERRC